MIKLEYRLLNWTEN